MNGAIVCMVVLMGCIIVAASFFFAVAMVHFALLIKDEIDIRRNEHVRMTRTDRKRQDENWREYIQQLTKKPEIFEKEPARV